MMMSMALRFIPTLMEETDKIMSAQKARGADFETGKLLAAGKGPAAASGAAVRIQPSAARTSWPWPWRAAATTAARAGPA